MYTFHHYVCLHFSVRAIWAASLILTCLMCLGNRFKIFCPFIEAPAPIMYAGCQKKYAWHCHQFGFSNQDYSTIQKDQRHVFSISHKVIFVHSEFSLNLKRIKVTKNSMCKKHESNYISAYKETRSSSTHTV